MKSKATNQVLAADQIQDITLCKQNESGFHFATLEDVIHYAMVYYGLQHSVTLSQLFHYLILHRKLTQQEFERLIQIVEGISVRRSD